MNTKTQSPVQKILIVENEGDICLLLNIILSGKNTDIDHVSDISAAIDYVEKDKPSVILLSDHLPVGQDAHFMTYLQEFHPHIRIMMIPGFIQAAQKALQQDCRRPEQVFTAHQAYNHAEALLN